MQYFDWNTDKNERLKAERNVSFEDVIAAFEEKRLLDIIDHPNSLKYPEQKLAIVELHNYAYIVPLVGKEQTLYLITIYPSRKASKKYLNI